MADDESIPATVWPLPKFHFQVRWGAAVMSFQEVSGLAIDPQSMEYRHGDAPESWTTRTADLERPGNVTLRNGVFKADDEFGHWLNQIRMNTIERVPVTISLLNEADDPTMVWTLANAWPTRITGTDLKSGANEVAIETVEIAYEGLTIDNP